MPTLDDISTAEMLDDRAASIMDIKMVQKLQTDTIYGMSSDEFIRQNELIIQIIEEELDKRGVAYD
jgi:hypothetical protein